MKTTVLTWSPPWKPSISGRISRQASEEIFRVLKPDGTFAILNEGSDPDRSDWPKIDGFMKIYRPEELEALLSGCGFQEVQVHHGPEQIICVTGGSPVCNFFARRYRYG